MSRFSRFLLRLRQRALRCYEVGMLALLVGVAVLATVPAAASDDDADATHCGNSQSSATVMVR